MKRFVVDAATAVVTGAAGGIGLAPRGGPSAMLPIALLLILGGTALTQRRARAGTAIPTRP